MEKLVESAENFNKSLDEFVECFYKQFDGNDIKEMDVESIVALKAFIKLIEVFKALETEKANAIQNIENKLNTLSK